MDVEEAADRLYALAPEEFTATRDDLAKQAAGPPGKAIKALRKPSVAAHAVNRLVRDRAGDIDALLALGDELRQAMAGGGDLRGLTEQRRRAVAALVSAARESTGRALTAAVEADVAATLEAATADPTLGAAVRSGRLVKPLRYAGFGAMPDLDDVVATRAVAQRPATRHANTPATKTASKPAATRKAVPKPAAQRKAVPKNEATSSPPKPDPRLTELRARVLELAGAADDAQRRYDEASRAVQQARQQLEAAESERAEAHRAASAAHREAEKARRELGRLERT